jgi:hypothetical protein
MALLTIASAQARLGRPFNSTCTRRARTLLGFAVSGGEARRSAQRSSPGETSDRQPATAVASTACRMSWVAASGWDTNDTCEAGTSTIVAFARSAMNRCSAGGIALSSVPSKYQHGSVFHAGGPGPPAWLRTRRRRRAAAPRP